MKFFMEPDIVVLNLAVENVIATSNFCEEDGLTGCDNETGRV